MRRKWLHGEKEGELTGSAKPGLGVHRVFGSQEIDPFGCVYALVELVLYKYGLCSLPINFRWFHYPNTERVREREFGVWENVGNVTVSRTRERVER